MAWTAASSVARRCSPARTRLARAPARLRRDPHILDLFIRPAITLLHADATCPEPISRPRTRNRSQAKTEFAGL